jgi:hypothetical protein
VENEREDLGLAMLLRELSPHRAGRKRGRPAIPHRDWLRAEVSRDLVNLLRREAEILGVTVTALMTVVLCDRYGVELGLDNRIIGFQEDPGLP